MNNTSRSDRAHQAVVTYIGDDQGYGDDLETPVKDLLTDLRHFADRHNFDLDDVYASSFTNYNIERDCDEVGSTTPAPNRRQHS